MLNEIKGELFEQDSDAICITTNGFTKTNGHAVMGRGCAKQFADMMPTATGLIGELLLSKGNKVHLLTDQDSETQVTTFPVKPVIAVFDGTNAVRHMASKFNIGDTIPGWACVADINIIRQSAIELVELANQQGWLSIVLPRPGCGAGELTWQQVKPVLEEILDSRFFVITY